jgi:hypothetical protein
MVWLSVQRLWAKVEVLLVLVLVRRHFVVVLVVWLVSLSFVAV